MALLGGLLRGTSGAFIRGSLGAASDMLQQAAARDDEEVQNRVQAFGSKYTTYNEKMGKYQEEQELINDVADVLSVQTDDFLTDISPENMPDVAQSLITLSGAKSASDAIKFFEERRNELSKTILPSQKPTTAGEAATVDSQTQAAMGGADTPESVQPSGMMAGIKRAFGGASNEELDRQTARQLGLSYDDYKRITSGTVPEIGSPSVQLILQQGSPFTETIKTTHKDILGILRKDPDKSPLNDNTVITLADGTNFTGSQEIRKAYTDKFRGFLKDPYSADIEGLYDIQNQLLTLAIPNPAAKDYIKSFDDDLRTIRDTAFNLDLNSDVRKTLLDQYNTAVDAKRRFLLNENPSIDDAENYENMIATAFATIAEMPAKPGEVKVPAVLAPLNETLKKFEALATDPGKVGALDEEDRAAIVRARNLMTSAVNSRLIGEDLEDAAFVINEAMQGISVTAKDPSILSKSDELKVASFIKHLTDAGFDGTDAQKRELALYHVGLGTAIGSVQKNGDYTEMLTFNAAGEPVMIAVDHVDTSTGLKTAPREVVRKAEETVANTYRSMSRIAFLQDVIAENPNAFNLIGAGQLYASDFFDLIGRSDIAKQLELADKAQGITKAKQDIIGFVKTIKDEIFDDPRLSDQDLAMIKEYIGLIDQPTIGITRSMGALNGMLRVFATSQALAISDKFVNLDEIKYADEFDANNPRRRMDLLNQGDTVAGMVLNNLLEAHNFRKPTKQFVDSLASQDAEDGGTRVQAYFEAIAPFAEMAENAAREAMARRRDPEGYKTKGRTRNLPDAKKLATL